MKEGTPRVLVIRRDNIGDLVCTTPLIHALRQQFPNGRIDALVNSYNAPVLERNPDIDAVHVYTKAKHRRPGESTWSVYWRRARLLWRLRQLRFDYAILASANFQAPALRTARLAKARCVIGFVHEREYAGPIDRAIWRDPAELAHEAEIVQRLGAPLGVTGPPGPLGVVPDDAAVARALRQVADALPGSGPLVGLHISARLPDQRWPAERFAALARLLHERFSVRCLLFWSPGDEQDPRHPGDDQKARAILEQCADLPVLAYPTLQLTELVTGLSLCDTVVCSDGGAMHVAAGLGKAVVCFFGPSPPERWHPWGVPYALLRSESRKVADVSVDEALEGYLSVREEAEARADTDAGTAGVVSAP